jgi:hypothetical protein
MSPGSTSATPTPKGATSVRRARLIASRAALLAEGWHWKGIGARHLGARLLDGHVFHAAEDGVARAADDGVQPAGPGHDVRDACPCRSFVADVHHDPAVADPGWRRGRWMAAGDRGRMRVEMLQ